MSIFSKIFNIQLPDISPEIDWLMLSVSNAGKNMYSVGKTSGVSSCAASGANRGYVLTRCWGGGGEVLFAF